jgi:hypothetical protein
MYWYRLSKMDITLIKQLIVDVGVPITVTYLFLRIVWDVYQFSKTKVAAHLERQS